MSWGVKRKGDGYVATWKGVTWMRTPWDSRAAVEAYVDRLKHRYPQGGDWLIRERENKPTGEGYEYSYPDGDETVTGTIHTSSLKDAKAALRRELDRRRLPNGIEWEAV